MPFVSMEMREPSLIESPSGADMWLISRYCSTPFLDLCSPELVLGTTKSGLTRYHA